MRFLVVARIKNLASKILSENVKRLSQDWRAIYGHPIMLAETFVDQRFKGMCYRAAGWHPLGQTKGFRRNGGRYYFHGQTKEIFVRPLYKNARQLLSAPFLSPQLQQQEIVMDLNSLAIEGDKGLFDRLMKITDPRKARGIRHNQTSILAIAIYACLSGCRSFAAIGQWSCNLTQELRRRFKCRISPRIKAVHLLSALLHKEGVVIAQKEVDSAIQDLDREFFSL